MATKPIFAGEEVTISYSGTELLYDSLERRQKLLPLLLGFECNCVTCDAEARLSDKKTKKNLSEPEKVLVEEEEKESLAPPTKPIMDVAEAAGFVVIDAEIAKEKKVPVAVARLSRRAKAKAAREAGEAMEAKAKAAKEKEEAAAAAAANVTSLKQEKKPADLNRRSLECALEESLGYEGHVQDMAVYHLEASKQLEVEGLMPCAKMRKKAVTLMESLDQHLARNDASTDVVLGQCWSLLHLLLQPYKTKKKTKNAQQGEDCVEDNSWPGLLVWPWLVHKYLDLFLRSFLEHGFRKPVAMKKDKSKRKLVWMIPPAELETFFTQLIQHHQQQTSAPLPFHLRILLAVLFTLFKQQVEPEHFRFQGKHSPLVERTAFEEAEEKAADSAMDVQASLGVASRMEPRLLAFLDKPSSQHSDNNNNNNNNNTIFAAEDDAMLDCDDQFGGERHRDTRLLSVLNVSEYKPAVTAAMLAKRRLSRQQRDFRWATTAVFLHCCFEALGIQRCTGNAALLVEVEAALCFSEWNESLLFAACSYDTPEA
jgi:hypothetical protein